MPGFFLPLADLENLPEIAISVGYVRVCEVP